MANVMKSLLKKKLYISITICQQFCFSVAYWHNEIDGMPKKARDIGLFFYPNLEKFTSIFIDDIGQFYPCVRI